MQYMATMWQSHCLVSDSVLRESTINKIKKNLQFIKMSVIKCMKQGGVSYPYVHTVASSEGRKEVHTTRSDSFF